MDYTPGTSIGTNPSLPRRLEQLDRIAVGILELDLLTAGPNFDLVAKMEMALAMSESEREEYRAKAMQRVREQYSWDAVTDAYERLVARAGGLRSAGLMRLCE